MANKIKSIAPVVIPSGGTQLSAETVVFGLDKDGGLWTWGMSRSLLNLRTE
jgi:hypothetical protein